MLRRTTFLYLGCAFTTSTLTTIVFSIASETTVPWRSWRRPRSCSGFSSRTIGFRSVDATRFGRVRCGRCERGRRFFFGFGPDCGAGAAAAASASRRARRLGAARRQRPRRRAPRAPRRRAPPQAPRRRAPPRRRLGDASSAGVLGDAPPRQPPASVRLGGRLSATPPRHLGGRLLGRGLGLVLVQRSRQPFVPHTFSAARSFWIVRMRAISRFARCRRALDRGRRWPPGSGA